MCNILSLKRMVLVLMLLPLGVFGQAGMKFEHGISWSEIQAKAKAENKFIFMDAYTTWCGPCRQMSQNIFPLQEVGSFFNQKYINVKVQLDTTEKDNEEVKQWYKDGHDIMVDYKVNVFPTYLFFDPNGKLVHRAVGSSTPDKFIAKGEDALNPEKQYYVLLDQYKNGNTDPEFLKKLSIIAQEAYDKANTKKISKEYLQTQPDYTTADNLVFLNRFTKTSKDTGFVVIMNNVEKFDALRGKGAANKKIVDIIILEEVNPRVYKNNAIPDFDAINEKVTKKYPKHGGEAVASSKVVYYQNKQDWANFQTAVVDYMSKYSSSPSPDQINVYAKTIFDFCKDVECIKLALKWSKKSIDARQNPAYYNTYANILYKLGKSKEAIKWQEKALAATENNKENYQLVLDKMKKGEKTWME